MGVPRIEVVVEAEVNFKNDDKKKSRPHVSRGK
jgi:hypothetical protein